MIQVYDIGEDGGRWFVPGTSSQHRARVEVIKHLEEQISPTTSGGGDADHFAWEVYEALRAKATEYKFVADDRATEACHHSAPFGPRHAADHNADWIGSGIALGFTMPAWKDK